MQMHQQTAAFERLWSWTKVASDVYRSKNTFWGQFEVPLLDINPEGTLEREIKDTIEELDIMLHVAKCHQTVLKQYVHNADHMLDPYGEFGHAHKKIPVPIRERNNMMTPSKKFVNNNNNLQAKSVPKYIDDICSYYHIHDKKLGEGGFAKVRLELGKKIRKKWKRVVLAVTDKECQVDQIVRVCKVAQMREEHGQVRCGVAQRRTK
jgi:hypothetical protein